MLEYNICKFTSRNLFFQKFILSLKHLDHLRTDLFGDALCHGKIRLKINGVFYARHDAHLNIVEQLLDPPEKLGHIYSDSLSYRKGLDLSQQLLDDLELLIVCLEAVVCFPRF